MFPISSSLRGPVLWLSALFVVAPAAYAQEVEKKWESPSMGQPRPTERQAHRDIEDFYSSYEVDKPFAWEVKRQTVTGKKVIYHYRTKPDAIVTTDWVYKYNEEDLSSEEKLYEARRVKLASPPQCPVTSLVSGEWKEIPGVGHGDDGSSIADENWVEFTLYSYYEPTGSCPWASAEEIGSANSLWGKTVFRRLVADGQAVGNTSRSCTVQISRGSLTWKWDSVCASWGPMKNR